MLYNLCLTCQIPWMLLIHYFPFLRATNLLKIKVMENMPECLSWLLRLYEAVCFEQNHFKEVLANVLGSENNKNKNSHLSGVSPIPNVLHSLINYPGKCSFFNRNWEFFFYTKFHRIITAISAINVRNKNHQCWINEIIV